jgi:hypothetical protein
MTDLFKLILGILASRFKARATLEAENLVLRQQVNVLRRRTPKRPHLNNTDRFLFVWLYRWFPSVLELVAIVRPETIIRWLRAGFRASENISTIRAIYFSSTNLGHSRGSIARAPDSRSMGHPAIRRMSAQSALGVNKLPRVTCGRRKLAS